jgi:hypothetical protein
VGPGAGLDRWGKSRRTGIRFPDIPARSESLYRLRYPGSLKIMGTVPKSLRFRLKNGKTIDYVPNVSRHSLNLSRS